MPVGEDAEKSWARVAGEYQSFLPLRDLPWLRQEAPYYFEWLAHPPEDPWWDWAELRNRYSRVTAAVLNLSGWYDDAYGLEGAITNFNGLVGWRPHDEPRAHLVLGPWVHGVPSPASGRAGDLDFGPNAGIDYDALVLDFHDHYMRGIFNRFATDPPVRYFVMGANEWREAAEWPPDAQAVVDLYLEPAEKGQPGKLQIADPTHATGSSSFVADPGRPVTDPFDTPGPHDYRALQSRADVLTFETEPLSDEFLLVGEASALIYASCDCRDFDLWVRLLDVHPDGRSFNLVSPGGDVLRASYRVEGLPQPGQVRGLVIPQTWTAMRFGKGHRIGMQISASFDPHLSRNLQTGESEVTSAESRAATITIHHDDRHASRLSLPVVATPPR
jgi:putative CocE/NonD family hydrolase